MGEQKGIFAHFAYFLRADPTPFAKAVGLFVSLLILLSAVLGVQGCVARRALAGLQQKNQQLMKDMKDKEKEITKVLKEKEAIKAENVARKARVEVASRVALAHPAPPKAKPIPTNDGVLKEDLERYGLKAGLTFHLDTPSFMNLDDARRTWGAFAEAARVPGLEASLDAQTGLAVASKDYSTGLEKELEKANKGLQLGEESRAIWKQQESNFMGQLSVKDDQIRITKRKGKLKLVYGIGIGVLAKAAWDGLRK